MAKRKTPAHQNGANTTEDRADKALVIVPSTKRKVAGFADEKTQTVYANNTFVEASNFDVKIKFGQIQSVTPELVNVLDVVHVYMSHEHAKAFLAVFTRTVGQIDGLKEVSARGTKVQ